MLSETEFLDLVARAHSGRLQRKGDFYEVPTELFVRKVDVKMPSLPEIAFYTSKEEGTDVELLRKADQPFSPLVLSNYEQILIRGEDIELLKAYAEKLILAKSSTAPMPAEKRMEILRKSAILVVDDLFLDPSPENINKSVKVVGSFVHVLMKDPKSYLHLAKLSSHDPYTLQHSVGCAVNCIILGRKMGFSDEQQLMVIGTAGLLHDLGKVNVRKEVINKPGPLDDAEWAEMKLHPGFGFDFIKDNPSLSDLTKRAVLEHHEEKTGKGYPKGMRWEDVHIFSKIVCISDIFNALTTARSYSHARTPFDALKLMREKMMHKIDDNLFTNMVLIYGGKVE